MILKFKLCASNHGHHYIIPISGSDGFKKMLITELSLYAILQILSVTIGEITPILQVLTENDYTIPKYVDPNHLNLFDF